MYTVINFTDYRKEQSLEVIVTTDDVEYAKKVAYQEAKKELLEKIDSLLLCDDVDLI